MSIRNRNLVPDGLAEIHNQMVCGELVRLTLAAQDIPLSSARGATDAICQVMGESISPNIVDRAVLSGYQPREMHRDQTRVVKVNTRFPEMFCPTYGEAHKVDRLMRHETITTAIVPMAFTAEHFFLILFTKFDRSAYPSIEAFFPVGFVHPDIAKARSGWVSKDLADTLEAMRVPREDVIRAAIARLYERTEAEALRVDEELQALREALAQEAHLNPLGQRVASVLRNSEVSMEEFLSRCLLSAEAWQKISEGSAPVTERAVKRMAAYLSTLDKTLTEAAILGLCGDVVQRATARPLTIKLQATTYERVAAIAEELGQPLDKFIEDAIALMAKGGCAGKMA